MSGQQIGTVIGGVVGAYFGGAGGAQLGMAIGGTLGGAVDPTVVRGPKIGDGQTQTATDGAVIAWVQGTATVAGTIVQVGPRKSKTHSSGKGGGTVSKTYTATQSFAILVCESCELRDSSIGSILMVTQDGKLVYDVRPGSTMLEDSGKWLENVEFVFGGEDQMPHPTLEAITGVGNTPAYRGSCMAIFTDFDVSSAGDRIPTFQFTVSTAPGMNTQQLWHYRPQHFGDTGNEDFSAVDLEYDNTWLLLRAPFGYLQNNIAYGQTVNAYDSRLKPTINSLMALDTVMWIRRTFDVPSIPPGGYRMIGWLDNGYDLYVNGVKVLSEDHYYGQGTNVAIPPSAFKVGRNLIALRCFDDAAHPSFDVCYFDFLFEPIGLPANAPTSVGLAKIIERLATRGGLDLSDINVDDMSATVVPGYPIATASSASDCITPLIAAYFAYASEYDARLNFKFYGADADVTIARDDLIEGNDANDGAITRSLRNQATEFPRRIVGTYMDPAQNYQTCTVSYERRASTVVAKGDQQLSIPVVMDANTAIQAVSRALKVAYAKLEGTLEYSVPFGTASANYISLCCGEPVIFQNKRYVLDEVILSNGYLKLTTRVDRQDAYTSTVQATLGNAPAVPASPYSGPTTMYVMNLPSLRSKDGYGVYVAASAEDPAAQNWKGCTVEVSYDGQVSWQMIASIDQASTLGTIVSDEPASGTPLTVSVNGDLTNADASQIAAGANAFAVLSSSDVAEIGQFTTAKESDSAAGQYDLTGLTRGLNGTTYVARAAGERFTMLDSVYFVAIDTGFAGKTLYFRATGYGETSAGSVVSLVYKPDLTVIIDGGTTGT